MGSISFLCFGLAWAGRVAFDIETAPCPWTGYEFSPPHGECPKPCVCYIERNIEHKVFLKTMNCSQSGLNRLPDKIPKNVNKINLAHNKINSVVNKMFDNLQDLVVLDLSYNSISTIDANGLYHLKQLKELDLTGCGLSTPQLGQHVFAWTGSIEKLILDNNRFQDVPNLLLMTLIKLKSISMSFNSIERLKT